MCRSFKEDIWALDEEREKPRQSTPTQAQPAEDDLTDAWAEWSDVVEDEVVVPQPEQAPKSVREESVLASSSSNNDLALSARPAPKQRAGSAGADAWVPRGSRGTPPQRGAARAARVPQRQADGPGRSAWSTSGDDLLGVRLFRWPYSCYHAKLSGHVHSSSACAL